MTRKSAARVKVEPSGHTPGPWEARDYPNHDGDIWIDCNSWRNPKTASCRGGTLATVHKTGVGDEGTLDGNTRLIAAAPELYAALKALHDNVDKDLSGFWTESTSNFMQQAEAVLAKIEVT